MNIYDLGGALASLLSTYFFTRVDIKAWPVGMIATCINGWLYWKKGIYADTYLELFYFMSICYGWYKWSNHGASHKAALQHLNATRWIYLISSITALYFIIFLALTTFSNSTVAKLDALTTALSITAQCLTCYKVIESWLLWLLADMLYAFMYAHKDLPFHSLIWFVYIGFAVRGYLYWNKLGLTQLPLSRQPLEPTA